MRKLLTLLILLFTLTISRADEGMWLPSLIGEQRIKDMQSKGLKLTATDLYDINEACLKDAIVRFGGGCTGEMISDEGLLITNHHCGYGQIQAHSSVENDYLTHGFVAKDRSQELINKGLKVWFLEQMRDVTEQLSKAKNEKQLKKIKDKIINSATKGKGLEASIEPLYYGNQYYLFVYKVYKDVRMVFAPASAIGKFGGDTDNWMWPRHTGDFAIFRVYADKNNDPAEYSKDNVPFTPKKSFAISTKGVKEGDFTFVYGFPGRTQRYLHSAAIEYLTEYGNPTKIALRNERLNIMNKYQEQDPVVRIQYASKNASVSNAWKKWQGELQGLKRLGTIDKKRKLEEQFVEWSTNKTRYYDVVDRLQRLYDSLEIYAYAKDLYQEAPMAIEVVKLVLATKFDNKDNVDDFFKNYYPQIDKETAHYLLERFMEKVPIKYQPQFNNTARKLVYEIFATSLYMNKDSLKSATKEQMENDVAYKFAQSLATKYKEDILPEYNRLNKEITATYKLYMEGLMEMNPEAIYFPDANSTLRIAYGKVAGYEPKDAVYYRPVSTLDGVMQKNNPDIYDYDVPENLRDVYERKDYGRWEVDGSVPVAFISTNHTTGGNSGSPVLNANGELLGVNFDRVWEGTMSDLEFDPEVCRNIAIDIRYVLFLMDKVYGAGYLLDEMVLVE